MKTVGGGIIYLHFSARRWGSNMKYLTKDWYYAWRRAEISKWLRPDPLAEQFRSLVDIIVVRNNYTPDFHFKCGITETITIKRA